MLRVLNKLHSDVPKYSRLCTYPAFYVQHVNKLCNTAKKEEPPSRFQKVRSNQTPDRCDDDHTFTAGNRDRSTASDTLDLCTS